MVSPVRLASFLLLTALCISTAVASADDVIDMPRPSLAAVRLEAPPVIDGDVLDDPVWMAIEPVTDFWQSTPDTGAPSSERTEVRIAYTSDTLLVAVVCYDRDPSALVIAEGRRDSPLDDADSFRLILDTYRDRQNGFVFGTNPNGIEYDGQVTNEGQGGSVVMGGQQGGSGGGFNLNWDGSWRVRTRVGDYGWSAEFAIPFRTLRYASGADQAWGLNLQRNIRRRNEVAYWSPLPRQFSLVRLSQAGSLTGLQIATQRNLKLTPYALGRLLHEGVTSGNTSSMGDVGADLKYSITPSLTLDATINTDFAQVEVDEQQINLDRFNLFFPEKRPFFLENAGLFSVGSPAEVELFFSRRIGIGGGGQLIPILGGGRLSGQVGGVNVGVLNMQTDSVGTLAGNNFSVARMRKDLRNRSNVGGIVVNRQGTGSLSPNGDWNRSAAIDGRIGIGRYSHVAAFAAVTSTPGLSGDARAWEVSAQHNSTRWMLTGTFTDVGTNFNPEVGFLARNGGFRRAESLVYHRYRPANTLGLLEVRPHVSYKGYWDPLGRHEFGFLHIDNHYEWKSGYEFHSGLNLTHQGVYRPFEIFPGVVVPVGSYDHQEAQLVFYSNQGAPVSMRLTTIFGGFYGGDRVAVTPTVRIRLRETFDTQFSLSRNDIDLPGGSFQTTLARLRVSYSFTPRMFVQSLVQYNDRAGLWSTNLRFGWIQQANTGLFVVYTDRHPLDDFYAFTPLDRRGTDRSFVVKFSRMVDLLN
jgi:hypothetical protein